MKIHKTLRATPAMAAGLSPSLLDREGFGGNGERLMADLEKLKQAIRDLHGLESVYLRSEPVAEVLQGKPVWLGTLAVFEVQHGDDENGEESLVAVLGKSPIDSARKAVQAFVVRSRQNLRLTILA